MRFPTNKRKLLAVFVLITFILSDTTFASPTASITEHNLGSFLSGVSVQQDFHDRLLSAAGKSFYSTITDSAKEILQAFRVPLMVLFLTGSFMAADLAKVFQSGMSVTAQSPPMEQTRMPARAGLYPLQLGSKDGTDAAFTGIASEVSLGPGFTAADFPKEINLRERKEQIIHFVADQELATKGLNLYLEPYWSNDETDNTKEGILNVEASVKVAGVWVRIGEYRLNKFSPGSLTFPGAYLNLGPNSIRLVATGGTNGVDTVTWRRLIFRVPQTRTFFSHGVSGSQGFNFDEEAGISLDVSQEDIYAGVSISAKGFYYDPLRKGSHAMSVYLERFNDMGQWEIIKQFVMPEQPIPLFYTFTQAELRVGKNRIRLRPERPGEHLDSRWRYRGPDKRDTVGWEFIQITRPIGADPHVLESLERYLDTTLNYFYDRTPGALQRTYHPSGLPLTALDAKKGQRKRFYYSKPAEWGYFFQGWIMEAERAAKRGVPLAIPEAAARLMTAMRTLAELQEDPNEFKNGAFYSFYELLDKNSGEDLPKPTHTKNNLMRSSDDMAFLWASLNIVQGWFEEKGYLSEATLVSQIKGRLNMRQFLKQNQNGKLALAHFVDDGPGFISDAVWDIFSNEGGLIPMIAYLMGQITFEEYKEITGELSRESRTWQEGQGANAVKITVAEASFFNYGFTFGVRALSGVPIAEGRQAAPSRAGKFGENTFLPVFRGHLKFAKRRNIYYPMLSLVMTQLSNGALLEFKVPPNLFNEETFVPNALPPYALFLIWQLLPEIDPALANEYMAKIRELEVDANGYFHPLYSPDPFGFEVVASHQKNFPNYPGVDNGRYNFGTLDAFYAAASMFIGWHRQETGQDPFYYYASRAFRPGGKTEYAIKMEQMMQHLYGMAASFGQPFAPKNGGRFDQRNLPDRKNMLIPPIRGKKESGSAFRDSVFQDKDPLMNRVVQAMEIVKKNTHPYAYLRGNAAHKENVVLKSA